MKHRWIYIYVLVLLLAQACKKDKQDVVLTETNGVYICNEGNFNFGSAEVSFYNPAKQEISNGLFNSVNNYMLGDVAQSVYIKDSLAFIVVNNSQKIEVVKLPSFKVVRTITIPASSPRYFIPVNDSIAYVTDLYAGKLHVINYLSAAVVKTISSHSQWTEHLLKIGNDVLVEERNLSGSAATTCSIMRVDALSHTFVERRTFTGANPNGMVADKNGRIWVAVEQDTTNVNPPVLYCLNNDLSTHKTIVFPAGKPLSHIAINAAADYLYYLNNGVGVLGITDTAPSSTPLIAADGRNFYALGIDPVTEEIYVADALDYVQPSRIYRYTKSGALVHSFTAGVIAGNFTFRYE